MSAVDAKQLLHFNFHEYSLKEKPETMFSHIVVDNNIKRLDDVSEKLDEYQSTPSDFHLDKTRTYLYHAYQTNVKPEELMIDHRSLKGFCYYVIPGDFGFNQYFFNVVNSHWNSVFLYGLIHSLLSNWSQFELDERKQFADFIKERVKEDDSHTSTRLKDSANYLSENGPYQLGHTLQRTGKSIYDCCRIFSLPRNRFIYSYFSDTIAGFFSKNNETDFEELKRVLILHNNMVAKKKVLPIVIIANGGKGKFSDRLLKISIELIGDPFLLSKWSPFTGCSVEEEENLEKARKILVSAISAEFINIFFRVLTNDSRRLEFWLKKTKHISDFRVFGSSFSRAKMSGRVDDSILRMHYTEISSNQDTCALVMFVQDFAIIEFTDVGALYVYTKSNKMYSAIYENRNKVDKMDDLKLPYINKLIDIDNGTYSFLREGKMIHMGNWESRLDRWFNRIVL